jgi:multiple sugar transport system ATP-binding protein
MASVDLKGISKSFGATRVLQNIDLSIADGEFISLLGPSGCGKSTLLRIIAGFEAQDAGSVEIAGKAIDRLSPKQRDVAMVFQSYALYPYMTVAQNIALPLSMRRLNTWQRLPIFGPLLPRTRRIQSTIDADVAATADALSIRPLLDRKPGQLSGGQRQRVALGRAMVRQPKAFLMDEPLSSLDAKLRVQMRTELVDLHRRLSSTFIYVTHDQAEAMTMSNRIAVMHEGRLLQLATPQDVYNDPVNLTVASFIGTPRINTLPGVVDDRGSILVGGTLIDARLPLPSGTAVTVGIRPEAFTLVESGRQGALTGAIHAIEHLGSDLLVHIDIPGVAEPVVARANPDDARALGVGRTATIVAAREKVLIFDEHGLRVTEPNPQDRVSAGGPLEDAR